MPITPYLKIVRRDFVVFLTLVLAYSSFLPATGVLAQEQPQQQNENPDFEFFKKTDQGKDAQTEKLKEQKQQQEKFELGSKSVQFSLLLTGYLFVFPIASGIVIFFISRGIVRGIMKAYDLKRKHRMIYISCGIGVAVILFATGVFTVRTTFAI